MTQEQKRIAIAEACGATGWEEARALPDYFNDLNAVHEAEKVLTAEQISPYVDWLEFANDRWSTPAFATAAQRAEALGKTLNLW